MRFLHVEEEADDAEDKHIINGLVNRKICYCCQDSVPEVADLGPPNALGWNASIRTLCSNCRLTAMVMYRRLTAHE
jgi:hypothetical protein